MEINNKVFCFTIFIALHIVSKNSRYIIRYNRFAHLLSCLPIIEKVDHSQESIINMKLQKGADWLCIKTRNEGRLASLKSDKICLPVPN